MTDTDPTVVAAVVAAAQRMHDAVFYLPNPGEFFDCAPRQVLDAYADLQAVLVRLARP